MKKRAISPLVATLVLIIAALALGGLLFTQFRSLVAAGASTAYVDIIDYAVSSDGSTLTLTIKNVGNRPVTITSIIVNDQQVTASFYPSQKLNPGDIVVAKASGQFPTSGELTVIIVGDSFSRAFTLPL